MKLDPIGPNLQNFLYYSLERRCIYLCWWQGKLAPYVSGGGINWLIFLGGRENWRNMCLVAV